MSGVVLVCSALLMHYGFRLFVLSGQLLVWASWFLPGGLGVIPHLVHLSDPLKVLSVSGSLMPMALVIGSFLLVSGSPSWKTVCSCLVLVQLS